MDRSSSRAIVDVYIRPDGMKVRRTRRPRTTSVDIVWKNGRPYRRIRKRQQQQAPIESSRTEIITRPDGTRVRRTTITRRRRQVVRKPAPMEQQQ